MINYLKNKIKSWKFSQRFPRANVEPTAYITSDSMIGTGVAVGESSSIITSILDDNVCVNTSSKIFKSTIGTGSVIKSATIKTSIIGSRVNVMSSSYISGSTIGKLVTIYNNNYIDNSILDNYVTIYNNSSVTNSNINNNVTIYSDNNLQDTRIGRFSYFASRSKVSMAEFGSFCSIGPELICGQGDHPTDFVSTSPLFFSMGKQCGVSFSQVDMFEERKNIIIGNDVWIGARAFIRDGVKVGNGAIIAAGSVVVKDVPDFTIVGGVPAKVLRHRFAEEVIQRLNDLAWWDWAEDKLIEAQPYFAQNDIYAFLEWAKSFGKANK